ncbi:protein of unknown function [Sterolibacterium denitrificans]|uniref:Cytotoxic translational repressor of toxin-antitoxin stability system n=1 Tax=Sterolibacterium denitrificans TaxID=157592 RepID=A0A7Z7HRA9_9PROT|nr:hypothetical protein [Sterolibacterium denitrificans]SMB27112.1 protein of unknown function [Sterolibacterium denitrificans]
MIVTRVDRTRTSFVRSFQALPDEIARLAAKAIAALLQDPLPKRLRFHKLEGYRNPKIYTIDITQNHSHKISLELIGTVAVLRKAATHKEIDRAP